MGKVFKSDQTPKYLLGSVEDYQIFFMGAVWSGCFSADFPLKPGKIRLKFNSFRKKLWKS